MMEVFLEVVRATTDVLELVAAIMAVVTAVEDKQNPAVEDNESKED